MLTFYSHTKNPVSNHHLAKAAFTWIVEGNRSAQRTPTQTLQNAKSAQMGEITTHSLVAARQQCQPHANFLISLKNQEKLWPTNSRQFIILVNFSLLQYAPKKPALGWLLQSVSCYLLNNPQTDIAMQAAIKISLSVFLSSGVQRTPVITNVPFSYVISRWSDWVRACLSAPLWFNFQQIIVTNLAL